MLGLGYIGVINMDCVCCHGVGLCQTKIYSAHTHGYIH